MSARPPISNQCRSIAVISEYNSQPLMRLEATITRNITIFYRIALTSGMCYIIVPGILQYQDYATGTVTNQTYEAPFHDM